jgi:hypothetical protein
VIEIRLRNKLRSEDLEPKVGKVLGPSDYDAVLTGAARVLKPDGKPLCVYLPGAMKAHSTNDGMYSILSELRKLTSNNRGISSGTVRMKAGGTRSYGKETPTTIIGMMDPAGQQRYCRLTAWTGRNMPEFETLRPLFQTVAQHFARQVPDRYAAQMDHVRRTNPDWVIPGTPFTTITVNNTYPTGMHKDAGDLAEGFSSIACLRRGEYTGGRLMFPEYRVAVDLRDGDLILMDAHEWHANEDIVCACGERRFGLCGTCGAERISVVSYFRSAMVDCGSAVEEAAKAEQVRSRKK